MKPVNEVPMLRSHQKCSITADPFVSGKLPGIKTGLKEAGFANCVNDPENPSGQNRRRKYRNNTPTASNA
jgi:hypothetical protein